MAAIAAIAISAGVAAYSAHQASEASKKAAAQQQAAAQKAIDLQNQRYAEQQKLLNPYTSVGEEALGQLRGMAGQPANLELPTYTFEGFKAPTTTDLQADPAYRLRQAEEQRAIQQSAAARGGGLGGNTLTALQDRSQALASDEYGNTFNRALATHQTNASQAYQSYLSRYNAAMGQYGADNRPWERWSQLAGLGSNATGMGIAAGQNNANQVGNLYTGIGNAQAAGTIGSANAINTGLYGISDAAGAYAGLQAYNTAQKTTPTTAGMLPVTTPNAWWNANPQPEPSMTPAPAYSSWGYTYGQSPWYQQPKQRNPWDVTF